MAALNSARVARFDTIKAKLLPLGATFKAFRGGMACADTSAAVVKPGAAGNANLLPIGVFEQDYDNSAGGASVSVQIRLFREIWVYWWDNQGNISLASNLFQDCYILDDHTVTITATSNSKAGRIWGVDSLKGVLVQAYTIGE